MVFPTLSELGFGVEGALAAQAARTLGLRDKFGLHEGLLALGKFQDLSALAFCEIFIHILVRPVAERFEGNEFCGVLDIAVLLVGTPAGKVVVLEDEVSGALGLLSAARVTSWTKAWPLVWTRSAASSL